MSGIHKVKEELHNKLLRLRSIESLVNSVMFDRLWECSGEDSRKIVTKFIVKADKIGVSVWVKTHPSISYGEMGTQRLKEIAKRMYLPNYSRLSHLELIQAIQNKEQSDGKKQK